MLRLKIISPEKRIFDGDVNRVTVPGTLGEFEILVNHAPIISSLESGKVSYEIATGELKQLEIESGFVEVQKNVVSLCVEL
ncbi:ATP synthase F1 subunit epsilon [Hoylesella timonensis]|uniref:ATP synthase, delta/epsilon subunit, beta-sandwich domain protein n=1 Tax=Hoylesella timonensis CRIS 5C-B1 TaxID=679189 RepID=D1W1Y5_9BACT|nr:ATP synthase F1 subunit epsilon [Hoylesella timonensis]EFA96669.1 ATP synthase, delta/epsilon subunit, beta-sandwich domain protein [Hoylesella timonensis CRIS 5C-B1]